MQYCESSVHTYQDKWLIIGHKFFNETSKVVHIDTASTWVTVGLAWLRVTQSTHYMLEYKARSWTLHAVHSYKLNLWRNKQNINNFAINPFSPTILDSK